MITGIEAEPYVLPDKTSAEEHSKIEKFSYDADDHKPVFDKLISNASQQVFFNTKVHDSGDGAKKREERVVQRFYCKIESQDKNLKTLFTENKIPDDLKVDVQEVGILTAWHTSSLEAALGTRFTELFKEYLLNDVIKADGRSGQNTPNYA